MDIPTKDLVIRPMTSADIPHVAELHRTLLSVKYPSSFFLHLLIQPTRECLIAHSRASKVPIGFVSASVHDTVPPSPNNTAVNFAGSTGSPVSEQSDAHVQILTLGVHPDFQSSGIADRLVADVVSSLYDSFKRHKPSFTPMVYPSSPGSSDTESDYWESRPVSPTEKSVFLYAHTPVSNRKAQKFYERLGLTLRSDVQSTMYRNAQVQQSEWAGVMLMGRVEVV